ncbi:ATPase [Virgibacillus halodenitrificans]|uniref:Cd(2+)-exporting ATPase n=1 Tax=Virgibacillus halodenitrificans TaxID=1482 RepID=A0AAC9IZ87_VIRHA|nr:heavy metal translocating P-type ATPase [Virgibacillus halodenitrificans]APC47914.1 ATPase [Virgibacillus halodenitrificans]
MGKSCCGSNKADHSNNACCSQTTGTEQNNDQDKLTVSNEVCCNAEEENAESEPDSSCCSGNSEIKEDKAEDDCSNKRTFVIEGMDCPSCAASIEKAVNKIDGLEMIKLNYNTAKLVAAGTEKALDAVPLEVNKLGFTASMEDRGGFTSIYEIEGMDCGNCAKSIESHMRRLQGVNDVTVSFSTGKMKLSHSNKNNEMVKEIEKLGYKAVLVNGTANKLSSNKQRSKEMISIYFSGGLIAIAFFGSFYGLSNLIGVFLYAAAIAINGYKPIKAAFYSLKNRSLDMNVLMSAAAIGAALIGEWFEGATVVWLFALGNVLQNNSMEQTRKSIRGLMDLAPAEAWLKTSNGMSRVPAEQVSLNSLIIIKPGERIPLDGEIVKGSSSINQAPITGESIPVNKTLGDQVYAGTINEHASLEVKVTKLLEDTTIAKIIHLVEEAQDQRAPAQAFIDKFASIYTPIVFVLAFGIMIIPPLLGLGGWSEWIYKGLALLIVACPCALVISTPVAIVSAIGNAAKQGVLIKGGTFLEKAGEIDAIAFDKTGTLTEGKPNVSEVHTFHGSEQKLIAIARTLEEYSTHPIAHTIVEYAKKQEIETIEASNFTNIAGKGVQAMINDETYYAGNPKLFKEMGVDLKPVADSIKRAIGHGKTIVLIGTRQMILGMIAVSDSLRPTTVNALQQLDNIGVKQIVMLTGDNEGTAKMISKETKVNRYFAELMPEDKVDTIKKLQEEGHSVAMVGDGINDAPALATSELGIAMGGAGTDTAMETADIVLMADNLEKLPYTIRLSRKALSIIKQNIAFSLLIKLAALILIFPGWLTLWMAVLSDTGAAVLVILNALRLLRVRSE